VNFRNRPEIDWDDRQKQLIALLDKHDGRCIVPSSGGKDSTYIALRLKEYGADVTAVTATTCHLTPIGRANIDNLARHVRTIEVTPNMTVRAKLNRIGLELVGDISFPEHLTIFSTPFRMAVALKTPLLFYGENPQSAYGGPPGSERAMTMTRRWVSEYGGLLGLRPADLIGMDGITAANMADYVLPSDDEMQNVSAYFLGQFEEWDSHRNAKVAKQHGMRQELPSPANWWNFENLDCTFTSAHDYLMWRKYRFGRATSQLSVDIRAGRISREEALPIAEVRDGIMPDVYAGVNVWDAMESIGISKTRFFEIADAFSGDRQC
jgi:hypothetical protein